MHYKKNRFQNNFIFGKEDILSGIKKLNLVEYKTLLVIDKNQKLLGTLTDGDIRRGILKGYSLKNSIKSVMNIKPLKFLNKVSINEKNYFLKNNCKFVPIVDKKNKIIRVELLENNQKENFFFDDTEILLMAGGFGKRLLPYTKKTPKPLLKIGNKTVLEMAISNFQKYGFDKFNISVFYKSSVIKKYFKKKIFSNLKIHFINEREPLGTAGCLSLINIKRAKENIIVYNGDIITDININELLRFHRDTNSDITVCAKEHSSKLPYGKILFTGHKVKKIIEKPESKNFFNAGIYVIKKKLILKMKIKKIDMTEFIYEKINNKYNINIYPVYEYWADMGNLDIFRSLIKKN